MFYASPLKLQMIWFLTDLKEKESNSKVSATFCTRVSNQQDVREDRSRHGRGSVSWGRSGLVQGGLNSEMCSCFHGVILVVLSKTKADPLWSIYVFKTFFKLSLYDCSKQNSCRHQKSLSSQAAVLPTLKHKTRVPSQTTQLFICGSTAWQWAEKYSLMRNRVWSTQPDSTPIKYL